MKKKAKSAARPKTTKAARSRSALPTGEASVVRPRDSFPIIGLGASAGGLEALEAFFSHLPAGNGLAVVIIQHLDPNHKGIMAELLQRRTSMKVVQVRDRMPVVPECVYVIPPNKDMSLLHGVLHLLEPSAPRGLRLPIDHFFRSLAADQRELSVGAVLSGMGSDGMLGLKAIKEQAGMVMVQDPASAKFDGMPRSAIDAGLADIVAPVEELPTLLLQYLKHAPLFTRTLDLESEAAQGYLEKIVLLLRGQTGHDFALYKRSTLSRRIERRMGLHKIAKVSTYVRYLRENPPELDKLFKELLIGVTSFFRDPLVWEHVRDEALPLLLTNKAAGHALRAWVPGCSTGEEAYSLAMVFKEMLEAVKPPEKFSLQIFATDLDRDAVDKARQGAYPVSIEATVSPERLHRFFVKETRGYVLSKEIREMVIFAPQNLIMDPPFTKLDFLSCRNLLIYLAAELQAKLMPLFHYSLNPGGILLLGSAESIGGSASLFTPIAGKARLFRRQESAHRPGLVPFPSSFVGSRHEHAPIGRAPVLPSVNVQSLAEQWILQHSSPAAILVDPHGDILFISGRTGCYLEPVTGKANWNVLAMARDELRYELNSAFQRAGRQKEPVTSRTVSIGSGDAARLVTVTVQVLSEPDGLRGNVMIVFTDVPCPAPGGRKRGVGSAPKSDRTREMEEDLQRARDEVQGMREQMQTSNEEFRSMNEELQSTNEELQSTNEELTTSKEELQSLNEELQTVNAELHGKVDELSYASNDMRNLLNSTKIATVFLDSKLRVRRFTETAASIIKFIPGDVGRPVTDLASELLYPGLADDAREVMRTLVSSERSIESCDGRWFAMRLLPYRTMDDRIDGVVITFSDVTAGKKIEVSLRERLREPNDGGRP